MRPRVPEIAPYLADQELNVSYAYWEGAVRISGQRADRTVRGDGYIELTGYAANTVNLSDGLKAKRWYNPSWEGLCHVKTLF